MSSGGGDEGWGASLGFVSSLDLLWSAFRACLSSRSLTGVAWPSRAAFAPDAVTAVPLVVRLALGMPRFSARLLAMEDCGRRRWVLGAEAEGELVRAAAVLVEAVVLVLSDSLLVPLALFLSDLRGASLIRPASLRWWSSSRLRMRRACR